ncbi:acyltransferase [Pseudoflavitalea sp. G-6-1-2]|nr:acyltransferase [Pseudoflavitalea sp. G-6-1-2]
MDIARCCAVLIVFLAHTLTNLYSASIPYLWYATFLGVELFFSLSGFLIGGMLIDLFNRFPDNLSLKHIGNFWARRWFRTLPLYFILYFIYLIVYNCWISPVAIDWKYLFFLQNLSSPPPAFFGESWSLGIEEWSYLSIPLLLFAAYLCRKTFGLSTRMGFYYVQVALLIIIIQIIIRLYNPDCTSWGCIAVFRRFDAVAYGLIAAYVHKMKFLQAKFASKISLAAGIILCFAAGVIKVKIPNSTYWSQLYFPVNGSGTALIIIGLYYTRFTKRYAVITFISMISYSIYLIHLSGVIIPLKKITAGTFMEGTFMLCVISVVLSIALAALSYKIIEQPFLRMRDRWIPAYNGKK